MKSETLTLILVNLAGIMEKADESLLPGVYKEVGQALNVDPTGLGSLTLFRSIVQSLCYPLAAYLACRHNRAHVIALGAFLWAGATFLVAFSRTFAQFAFEKKNQLQKQQLKKSIQWKHSQTLYDAAFKKKSISNLQNQYQNDPDSSKLYFIGNFKLWTEFRSYFGVEFPDQIALAISRGLNGIGLSIVVPAIQSLVADSTNETNRGTAFGWLHFTANVGSILGGLFSVLIASTSFMGIPGWRIAFHLVGLLSVVVGLFVALFAKDPHFLDNKPKTNQKQPFWLEFKDLMKEAKMVIKIPTFQAIVAQGIAGSFPGSALSFAPMWLELIGFSRKKVAFLWMLFIFAAAVGGLFGGKMGDVFARYLPNTGRIILAQISSSSGIPLAAILMLVLSDEPSTAFSHGLVLFVMGLTMSWCGTATNNPIFAEIVPEKSRTSIYALDRSLETILSSFAPPIVGILAQHVFGYVPVKKGSTNSEEIETDRENAVSLAKALYTCIGVPFTICCLLYSILYWTYPRDRERARMDAMIDLEMERIEDNERSVLDIDYEVEDRREFDENDEKRLLSEGMECSDSSK